MISNFDHYLGGNSHVLQVRPCNPELKSPRPLQGRVTLRRKTILFSGDQRQVCPVLKSATETKIVDHAFLSASMWQHVERFRLTVSMSAKDEIPFAKPVLQSGGRRGQDRTRLTTRWFSCYPFETPSLTAAVQALGISPRDLHLKIGALLFFIRNINFDIGLVYEQKSNNQRNFTEDY